MNASQIAELLESLLYDVTAEADDPESEFGVLEDCRFQTFAEAGLLTTDDGLVLSLADGSEFQITIIQSKGAQR